MKQPSPITDRLLALADSSHAAFLRNLIPTIPADTVLGIKIPVLRKFAKEVGHAAETAAWMQTLPHTYLEENLLHALLLNGLRDPKEIFAALDAFLPFVDNWAVCDSLFPKALQKLPEEAFAYAQRCMSSDHPFTVRWGIGVFLQMGLDAHFDPKQLQTIAAVPCEHPYVALMVAWYFATALAKQWDAALPYLVERTLPLAVHRKTIQKAVESYRIPKDRKSLLKALRS